MDAAPVVAGDELLPRQSLRIDLAAPSEVAVLSVVTVFDSIFGHAYQLAHKLFVSAKGWETLDQCLAGKGWLVYCANARDSFKRGSHVIAGENFPNDR